MTTANGRVMFVAAHPDDPEFLAGGIAESEPPLRGFEPDFPPNVWAGPM